jgi:hypothetical protein
MQLPVIIMKGVMRITAKKEKNPDIKYIITSPYVIK